MKLPCQIATTFAALALFLAACSASYTPTPAEQSAISARVDSFNQAFLAGNYPVVIDAVPPKVYATAAARSGVTPRKLRSGLIDLTRKVTKDVQILSFGMNLDAARYGQTPAGNTYALIPTQSVVQTPSGAKVQSNNTTLALQEDDLWYLVRIDEPAQRALLVQAYPEFENVTFPKGTRKSFS